MVSSARDVCYGIGSCSRESCIVFFFFFQAEDGIRDVAVTGVQTCALPICTHAKPPIADEQVAEAIAWQLLRRDGVVFRRMLLRETLLVPWREILRVLLLLMARGEILRGWFAGRLLRFRLPAPLAIRLILWMRGML